jgi:hypothetical protein
MVRHSLDVLTAAGAPDDSIRREDFGYDSPPQPLPALSGSGRDK